MKGRPWSCLSRKVTSVTATSGRMNRMVSTVALSRVFRKMISISAREVCGPSSRLILIAGSPGTVSRLPDKAGDGSTGRGTVGAEGVG